MCFSATASFVAGGTLSVVGGGTLSRVQHRREVPFVHISLLFGIQQIVEGFVWLGLTYQAPELKQTMTYVYSAFSHVLRPMYVPKGHVRVSGCGPRRGALGAVLDLAATCFTGTVSSHMFVRLFGGMALLAFFGAYLFAADAVVSVWCFFAAILSLLIYLHLRYRQLGGFPKADLAVAPMPLAAS